MEHQGLGCRKRGKKGGEGRGETEIGGEGRKEGGGEEKRESDTVYQHFVMAVKI